MIWKNVFSFALPTDKGSLLQGWDIFLAICIEIFVNKFFYLTQCLCNKKVKVLEEELKSIEILLIQMLNLSSLGSLNLMFNHLNPMQVQITLFLIKFRSQSFFPEKAACHLSVKINNSKVHSLKKILMSCLQLQRLKLYHHQKT